MNEDALWVLAILKAYLLFFVKLFTITNIDVRL